MAGHWEVERDQATDEVFWARSLFPRDGGPLDNTTCDPPMVAPKRD
jgi:hypothetical protein